jgi:hypothetical protein
MLINETELFQNMKCYANKKVWMTTNTSTELLRVEDPTIVVQGKNHMLLEEKCPTYPHDTLINVYYPPNFKSMMPSTSTGCG